MKFFQETASKKPTTPKKKETPKKATKKEEPTTSKRSAAKSRPSTSGGGAEFWPLSTASNGNKVAIHVKPGQAPKVIEFDPKARIWPVPSCLLD